MDDNYLDNLRELYAAEGYHDAYLVDGPLAGHSAGAVRRPARRVTSG